MYPRWHYYHIIGYDLWSQQHNWYVTLSTGTTHIHPVPLDISISNSHWFSTLPEGYPTLTGSTPCWKDIQFSLVQHPARRISNSHWFSTLPEGHPILTGSTPCWKDIHFWLVQHPAGRISNSHWFNTLLEGYPILTGSTPCQKDTQFSLVQHPARRISNSHWFNTLPEGYPILTGSCTLPEGYPILTGYHPHTMYDGINWVFSKWSGTFIEFREFRESEESLVNKVEGLTDRLWTSHNEITSFQQPVTESKFPGLTLISTRMWTKQEML